MKQDKPSLTAKYMALFRAIENRRPAEQRLFTDAYARLFLNKRLKWIVSLSANARLRKWLEIRIQQKAPGAMASGIARTRYIDDLMLLAIEKGNRQLIILGAGFDTRALRLTHLQTIPVIEIDHPDTAKRKLTVLQKNKIISPSNIHYYQIDFNKQNMYDFAAIHQIDFSTPTVIIWEGVTNYLVAEAVDATFRFANRFTSGSHIIFTYLDELVLKHPEQFTGGRKLMEDLNRIEERWIFGLNPKEVAEYLKAFDFKLLYNKGAAEYSNQYLSERKHLAGGYDFYYTAMAERH